MTISEIKDLAKKLNEEDVDKIKEEIRSKENILKGGNLEEEEMMEVLNTLFSILVIEKALESEIEGVEEIRADLEEELLEAYEIYDSYMVEHKRQDKKKKRRWLLDFLFLSDKINNRRTSIGNADKRINALKGELNELRAQRSNENLRDVCNDPSHRHRRGKLDNMQSALESYLSDLDGNGRSDVQEVRMEKLGKKVEAGRTAVKEEVPVSKPRQNKENNEISSVSPELKLDEMRLPGQGEKGIQSNENKVDQVKTR